MKKGPPLKEAALTPTCETSSW